MNTTLSIASVVVLASLLAGCGKSDICTEPGVLATVRQLFEEQEFGKFNKMPPGIVLVRDKSATHLSTDPATKIAPRFVRSSSLYPWEYLRGRAEVICHQ